ncbi:DoxX family protein [Streptomyces sp. NPDC049906]|uniref:DoxX family protein n=1 Tax=Streptomyces sp. NPDC049906 TaxID=3155656 RepID=UPI00342C33D6
MEKTVFVSYVVLAVLVSLLLVFSGRGMLVGDKNIVETMERVGVPRRSYTVLALLKFAGALGLLAGIFYRPLGIAAAVGLVLYFLGAVVAHLRADDLKGAPSPFVLAVVSAIPLVLGLATA